MEPVPQTFAEIPPPQVSGAVHVPHSTVRAAPQLSLAVTEPQFAATREQSAASSSGVHPHLFGTAPPPHVSGAEHVPQSGVRTVPHPSLTDTAPHSIPRRTHSAASDSAVQPQTFAVPAPPQV
jgi:hypothetical protein